MMYVVTCRAVGLCGSRNSLLVFVMRFLLAVEICFEIILCACVCILAQAIVTQEGSVAASSVHISMRISTKISVLKFFPFRFPDHELV